MAYVSINSMVAPPPGVCRAFSTVLVPGPGSGICFLQVSPAVGNLLAAILVPTALLTRGATRGSGLKGETSDKYSTF